MFVAHKDIVMNLSQITHMQIDEKNHDITVYYSNDHKVFLQFSSLLEMKDFITKVTNRG